MRWLAALVLVACGDPPCPPGPAGPNLLIVVADDIGVDKLGAYGLALKAPATPNIDALAEQGVRFSRAWSAPNCSAARAAALTGRHGSRTGVGRTIHPTNDRWALPLREVLLPEALCHYDSSAVGKWHLSTSRGRGRLEHPNEQGFAWYSGALGTLGVSADLQPGKSKGLDYFHFEKVVNGVAEYSDTYATTDTTDDAIARIEAMGDGPWLLWVAYHSAHTPLHVPPPELSGAEVDADSSEAELFDAMLQSLDTELGRLMEAVDLETTTVLFWGDNGTPDHAIVPPFRVDRAKGSLYEGGIHVPLIAAGAGVGQGVSDAFVQVVDLFATAVELGGGVAPGDIDGVSFAAQLADPTTPGTRRTQYAEQFPVNRKARPSTVDQAIRDERYKLVRTDTEQLYDMDSSELDEGEDLLALGSLDAEARDHYAALQAELDGVSDELGIGCATGRRPGAGIVRFGARKRR